MSPALRTRASAAALPAGTLVQGIGAYLFIALATRIVGAEPFAPVGFVWTAWTVVAAALTYPVQHLVVVRRANGERFAATELLPWVVGAGVLVAAVLGLGRERLVGTDAVGPALATGVVLVGAYWLGVSRGRIAAGERYGALGASLAVEGMARVVVLAPVALLLPTMTGGLVALLAALAALLVPTGGPGAGAVRGARADATAVGVFGVGNAIAMLVLSGGVLLLPALGASAVDTTALFATAALVRAPYLMLIGVSPRVVQALLRPGVRLPSRGLAVLGSLALAALAGAGGWLLGPTIVSVAFGEEASLGRLATGLLAAAGTLALVTLVLALVPVSRDDEAVVGRTWGAIAVLWLALALSLPVRPVLAVVTASLVAELVALLAFSSALAADRDPVAPAEVAR